MTLNTASRLTDPDDFYASLIEAHHGLSTEQSHAMNAALVLLLANHIADIEVIREALVQARQAALDYQPPAVQDGQSSQSPHYSAHTGSVV